MKNFKKVFALILSIAMIIPLGTIFASATPSEITAGNSMTTATNIPNYGTEYVSSLSTAGEVDWFKFTTKSEDAYYYFNFENYNISVSDSFYANALNMYLCDMYGQVVQHAYIMLVGGSTAFNLKLENNTTYYLKILTGENKKNSLGNYEIKISVKPDDVPNEKENAKPIALNNKLISTLDGTGDADWYSINTAKITSEYTFEFVNYDIDARDSFYNNALNLYLYDMYGKEIKHAYIMSKTGKTSFKVELSADSTYYFKILMGSYRADCTGTYEITVKTDAVTSEPDIEPEKPTSSITSIEITSLPTNLAYGYKDTVSLDGLAVCAHYTDGSIKDVTEDVTVTNFTTTRTGEALQATVEYEGCTATFEYSVEYEWWEWLILIFLFGWLWY